MAEKANSANKGSLTATLPKIISYTKEETRHIDEFLLDCNYAGEYSAEDTRATIHRIKILVLMYPTLSLTIIGHTTNSGGGRTLLSLVMMLQKFKIPGIAPTHIFGSCCLHNL